MTKLQAEQRHPASLVEEGRVHRQAFVDPEIFELELDRIFHGTWVYVGYEGELAERGDFITGHIGRQPIIVVRDQDFCAVSVRGGFPQECTS